MDPKQTPPSVMIIAGEASGDLHGARLVQALQARDPSLKYYGIGGKRLQAAGVRVEVDAATLAVVGITEVAAKLPQLLRGLSTAKQMLRTLRPGLLILIDFPDFNLKVAAEAKRLGIPVLYYISPQIWAWRPKRVHRIGRLVDHMAVILPFEADFYRRHNIPVTFVGHPLMDDATLVPGEVKTVSSAPVVGLLPGSRDREVARLLPVFLQAARRLKARMPGLRFLLSQAPSVAPELVARILSPFAELDIVPDPRPAEAIFKESTLVLATSGTVTLEAAISAIPMVIAYRVSPMSYWLGRALIRVAHIGLANLIAGQTVVPELIQGDASPERIASTVGDLLADPRALARQRRQLLWVREKLGGGGASERVAQIAQEMMKTAEGGR